MLSINTDEKENGKLLDNLQKLGFSTKEALVYYSLLALGEVGSSKIVKTSGLHGQFVYQALASLEDKGLVSHIVKSGRKKFKAGSPQVIARNIAKQELLAESVARELERVMTLPPEQTTETFMGLEAYTDQEFSLLKEAPPQSELLIIGGSGDQFGKIMKDHLSKYEKIRLKREIGIRYIGSGEQKDNLSQVKSTRELFDFRVLPGLFTGSVNTNIWQNTLGFNIYGNPVINFSIYNPHIAGSYRQFFETLWRLGKE